jgi:hypothetical protein
MELLFVQMDGIVWCTLQLLLYIMLVYQAHFRWGLRVQICRNQFGLTWSRLNPGVELCIGPLLASWLFKSCALLFSSFFFFFWIEAIDFPSKMVSCRFSLDLPLFGLGPHLKAMSPIYGCHPIRLLYFIGPWTLDPHLKLTEG